MERRDLWEQNKHQEIYNFPVSYNWFSYCELKTFILNVFDLKKKYTILEIGCYEGCSSCCIADLMLNDENSILICLDPFDENDATTPVHSNTENIFYENIEKSINKSRIRHVKKYSDEYFATYFGPRYNFIYIDGAHESKQIERDLENSFKHLEINGIIWCDD